MNSQKTLLLAPVLFLAGFQLKTQHVDLMGFSPKAAERQLKSESLFDQSLRAENLDAWMKYMSARPHHVGSPYDKKVVDFIASKFQEWGYDVKIEKFNVLFPSPKTRLLEMTRPTSFKASLLEPPVEGDASSHQTDEALPAYNCFSVDGDVTGALVYVNYGLPADYEELEKRGIDVKGKIVIARYLGSWRGIKPKVAAEKGAIGCIIYSDPKDDGYYRGDVYPVGPYKNEHGVQRGAVMDLPFMPGDPLTPGYGATEDAPRLAVKDAPSLTKIPVLPISYHDALPLLEALGGAVAPESWRGALPITYHMGPGPAEVHLKLEFNWDMKPAYDVIATLKGSQFPDEWVIRGNHHDAWVHGAADPISGMVALMEEARGVGLLAEQGHKPKRTIKYCAWGAEEPGLMGSTEWVETNAAELSEKAVAYINTDGTGKGFLGAGGSHTLEKFFDQITRVVYDPQKSVSVFERRNAAEQISRGKSWSHFELEALGSGSDYSPFFQHLGIAAFNLGFGGESSGGEYHTMYDSYELYKRFKDPDFSYGVTLAKVAGRTTLRLANADILPFEFSNFEKTVSGYLDEVIKMADKNREDRKKENELIRKGIYDLAYNPEDDFEIPKIKAEIPYLNFAPIQNSMESLKKATDRFSRGLKSANLENTDLVRLNNTLSRVEVAMTRMEGLPRRPWYRHFIYAPGFYTGYGVKTLPGVREAIEEENFDEAAEQILKLSEVLQAVTAKINAASASLEIKP